MTEVVDVLLAKLWVEDDEFTNITFYMPQKVLEVSLSVRWGGANYLSVKQKSGIDIFGYTKMHDFYSEVMRNAIQAVVDKVDSDVLGEIFNPGKFGQYKYMIKSYYSDYAYEIYNGKKLIRRKVFSATNWHPRDGLEESIDAIIKMTYNIDLVYERIVKNKLAEVRDKYRERYGTDKGYWWLISRINDLSEAKLVYNTFRSIENAFRISPHNVCHLRIACLYIEKEVCPFQVYASEEIMKRIEEYKVMKILEKLVW